MAFRGDAARRRSRVVRYVMLLAGWALLLNALVGENGLVATFKARDAYARAEQSLAELRRENDRLGEQARRLRDDPSTIALIARQELGLISPGETLVIVRDVPPPTAGGQQTHPSSLIQNP